MRLLSRQDYPTGKFTLAFVGYGDEDANTVIELAYNWGIERYDLGQGYGHIAIKVHDVYAACAEVKRLSGSVVREAGPMNAGTTIIADPDGYYIELIGKKG